jgi:flagellar hook assembly protein FlgD
VVTAVQQQKGAPESYEVMQAYPNPFNPSTTLKIRLPENVDASKASLVIYNTLGQSVRRFDVSSLSSKSYSQLTWDARNDNGSTVATGMYLVVLQTPTGRYTMKLMFIK